MVWVAGVRFKPAGKIYHFECEEIDLEKDDAVIVETVRGIEYGKVATGKKDLNEEQLVLPLKKVIRKANQEDEATYEKNKRKEKEALEICKQKVREHQLPMRLIDVEYTFDMGKVIFYFTAEGRVDFRELVKDLASIFKTRIELRQIGVRDEAKMIGGIGACGRILCCNNFLGEFEPVSIRMAKEQNLSLNPTKISGICGRLMCCLKYESELYEPGEAKGKEIHLPAEIMGSDKAEESNRSDKISEPGGPIEPGKLKTPGDYKESREGGAAREPRKPRDSGKFKGREGNHAREDNNGKNHTRIKNPDEGHDPGNRRTEGKSSQVGGVGQP